MQATNLSRRVAITGLGAAVVGVPVAAAASSPAPNVCSYPDLVEKLVAVRRRYIAQHKRCIDHSEACRAYATAKTGITEDEARAELRNYEEDRPEDGPKWKAWAAASSEYDLAHDYDPVDDDGCSIEWTEINTELNPLCRSILASPALSLADLGLMAQAYAALKASDLVDPDCADDSREARQLLEAVCKFCGVEPFPGLVYDPLPDADETET
jgi:hypothetical protein